MIAGKPVIACNLGPCLMPLMATLHPAAALP